MWPRWHVVHPSWSLHSCLLAPLHETVNLCWGADGPLAQPFNKDAFFILRVLSDCKAWPFCLKQVTDSFIINLKITRPDHEFDTVRDVTLDIIKDLFNTSGYDSSRGICVWVLETFHGVCLSCASLAVGKNSCVVSFQNWQYGWPRCILVDLFLSALWPVYGVERKLVVLY